MNTDDYKFYDFAQAEVLPKDAVRTISYLFENFARAAGTSLSTYLRFIAEVSLEAVEQIDYSDFISEMPYPTCILIVGLKPLAGAAVLELSLDLTFLFLDRLLGGKGEVSGSGRALTEIELTIVDKIVRKLLEEIETAWAHVVPFDLTIEGRETNPQMAQIVAQSERMLMLRFKVKTAGQTGYLKFGVPAMLFETLKDKLMAHQWSAAESGDGAGDAESRMVRHAVDEVKVPVQVMLGTAKLSLKKIMQLEPGNIICLMRDETVPVEVKIKHKTKFLGKIGAVGVNKAVKIVSSIA
jgi:flagellar motor switch protein FliM